MLVKTKALSLLSKWRIFIRAECAKGEHNISSSTKYVKASSILFNVLARITNLITSKANLAEKASNPIKFEA